ncbi:MAG: tautomerase family protein [Promethearchaeota archaeon]
MPVITIEGPPRDIETKRKLVKQFTAIFKEIYGYPEDFSHVSIIIRENTPFSCIDNYPRKYPRKCGNKWSIIN